MLPTVVDLWPDWDLLAIDGMTVVMVAKWDSRVVFLFAIPQKSEIFLEVKWKVENVSFSHKKQVSQNVYICESKV